MEIALFFIFQPPVQLIHALWAKVVKIYRIIISIHIFVHSLDRIGPAGRFMVILFVQLPAAITLFRFHGYSPFFRPIQRNLDPPRQPLHTQLIAPHS